MFKNILLIALCAAMLGCAFTPNSGSNEGSARQKQKRERADTTKFTANELFEQPIETIDIIRIVSAGKYSGKGLSGEDFADKFDQALRVFDATALQRNRLQDRLILASNELCENYKVTLKKKQSRFNFWAGTATTVFGAAGAIAPAASTASIFAALSGVSSGTRAEYNQNYFADLAAHVITQGINSRRSDILEKIHATRKTDLAEYTVEAAIGDVVTYHGACTLTSGLEQANVAVAKLDVNAGIDALNANAFFARSFAAATQAAAEAQKSAAVAAAAAAHAISDLTDAAKVQAEAEAEAARKAKEDSARAEAEAKAAAEEAARKAEADRLQSEAAATAVEPPAAQGV
ncbi:MAG: hypothetical protein SGI99_17705 [Pseudomonadota bacterium]|nr:hypothetical protein [Pseudomonadota bacterium]